MSLATLLRTPVEVQHRDITGAVTDTLEPLGYLEPTADIEPNSEEPWIVAAETYRTTWRLFLTPDVPIDSADRVVIGGRTFDVVDVHQAANARTTVIHHKEATVTRLAPPSTLVTIKRRDDPLLDTYFGDDDWHDVVTHVRCWLQTARGTETPLGTEEVIVWSFATDPVDLHHDDRLLDETTGELLEVLWTRTIGTAAGQAHVIGEAKLVLGAPEGPVA